MNDEIKFDHFENINELLEHIDLWYEEEDIYYERWFGLNDLKKLKDYITNLQEENEDLREENEQYKKTINEIGNKANDDILDDTEFRKWVYLERYNQKGSDKE